MKQLRLLCSMSTWAFVFALVLSFATASAEPESHNNGGNGGGGSTAARSQDTRILVKTVDERESTITIIYMRDKTTHTYTVDSLTVLKVNNVPGKISDVKAGMQISDYQERDPHTLDSATIDPAKPANAG